MAAPTAPTRELRVSQLFPLYFNRSAPAISDTLCERLEDKVYNWTSGSDMRWGQNEGRQFPAIYFITLAAMWASDVVIYKEGLHLIYEWLLWSTAMNHRRIEDNWAENPSKAYATIDQLTKVLTEDIPIIWGKNDRITHIFQKVWNYVDVKCPPKKPLLELRHRFKHNTLDYLQLLREYHDKKLNAEKYLTLQKSRVRPVLSIIGSAGKINISDDFRTSCRLGDFESAAITLMLLTADVLSYQDALRTNDSFNYLTALTKTGLTEEGAMEELTAKTDAAKNLWKDTWQSLTSRPIHSDVGGYVETLEGFARRYLYWCMSRNLYIRADDYMVLREQSKLVIPQGLPPRY